MWYTMNQRDEYFLLIWEKKRKKRKCSDNIKKSFEKLFRDSEDHVNMPQHLHFSIWKLFRNFLRIWPFLSIRPIFYISRASSLTLKCFSKTSTLHYISILNIIFDQVSLVEKEFRWSQLYNYPGVLAFFYKEKKFRFFFVSHISWPAIYFKSYLVFQNLSDYWFTAWLQFY